MIGIELFEFQDEAKMFLLDKTIEHNSKKKIIVKSPTGSGKTIILLSFIEDYHNNYEKDKIFIWLTPGQGNLEEQSREKWTVYSQLRLVIFMIFFTRISKRIYIFITK